MGLFSGIKKAVSKVAPIAGTVLGGIYGGPGGMAAGGSIGSRIGSMFGGGATTSAQDVANQSSGGWVDSALGYANSAIDIYGAIQRIRNAGSEQEAQQEMQRLMATGYDNSLEGIREQNATARELAQAGNEYNTAIMREAQQYGTNTMREQQYYNTTLANTAHQREAADLQAAGLNRILSGTGGMGSASPQASSPSSSSPSANVALVRSEGDALTSAFQAFTSMAEAMKANAATTYMAGAQTSLTQAQTGLTQQQKHTSMSQEDLNNTTGIMRSVQTKLAAGQYSKVLQELENLQVMKTNLEKQGKLTDAQAAQARQSTRNLGEVFKDLKMKGDISASEYGSIMEMVNRAPSVDVGKIINAIKRGK